MKKITLALLFFLGFLGSKAQNKIITDTISSSTVCGTCKSILEEGLKFEKGVIRVTVVPDEKKIILKYRGDKTDRMTLKKKITMLGYQADELLADPQAFESLPACCKKPHEDEKH